MRGHFVCLYYSTTWLQPNKYIWSDLAVSLLLQYWCNMLALLQTRKFKPPCCRWLWAELEQDDIRWGKTGTGRHGMLGAGLGQDGIRWDKTGTGRHGMRGAGLGQNGIGRGRTGSSLLQWSLNDCVNSGPFVLPPSTTVNETFTAYLSSNQEVLWWVSELPAPNEWCTYSYLLPVWKLEQLANSCQYRSTQHLAINILPALIMGQLANSCQHCMSTGTLDLADLAMPMGYLADKFTCMHMDVEGVIIDLVIYWDIKVIGLLIILQF